MNDYPLISAAVIVDKIRRDFKLSGTSWQGDVYEMIGECIQAIGYTQNMVDFHYCASTKNHRLLLPSNWQRILAVEYKCNPLPYRNSTRSSIRQTSNNTNEIFSSVFTTIDIDTNIETRAETVTTDACEYYETKGNYVFTSFCEGEIIIHYVGLPIDEDCIPMIIDTYEHKECYSWYIINKLLSGGYSHPVHTYKDSELQFSRFLGKAQNKGKKMTSQQMQSFANSFNRMVLDKSLPDNFFEGAENRQDIYGI